MTAPALPHPTRTAGVRRRAYLDNLKVTLVSGVIVGHVLIVYGGVGTFAYEEASTNDAFTVPATIVVALGSLFAMGLFFLLAGLLTPGSLARKGPGGFVRDRVLRLGVPFLAFLLLLYPLTRWMAETDGVPLGDLLRTAARDLDPGPLWFVLVLLVYSLGYVGWRRWRPAALHRRAWVPRVLVGFAAAIAAATFVVRLRYPIDSEQVLMLHLWQWPQCLGLFALGVTCAEHGWLDPVPDQARRACGGAALAGTIVLVLAFAVSRESLTPFAGGVTWQATVVAVSEGVVAVALSVWLLGQFQRRFDHAGTVLRAAGRAAYGAYLLQAPVVVGVAVLAAGVPLAPEVKALFVAPASLLGSFALAWGLTRVPGIRRIV